MKDIRGFFGQVHQTSEGFKADCPKCDDKGKRFSWNEEKGVGCCHHSGCNWYSGHGGVTEGRLLAFFSRSGVEHVVPDIIEESEEADVSLPEEFKLISELGKEDRDNLYAYLNRRQITKKIVDRAKLGYCTSGKLWGYIILPVFDDEGKVVYWQGRRFKDREPKFRNPTSTKKSDLVYCISISKKPHTIILVESVMNALTIDSVGSKSSGRTAVMAILGKSLSDTQRDKILYHERYLKNLYIALDGDARRDTPDIADKFKGIVPDVRIVNVPDGEDINSLGRSAAWKLIWEAEIYDSRKRMEFMMREV